MIYVGILFHTKNLTISIDEQKLAEISQLVFVIKRITVFIG
jgi:hypothetical protein